MKCNYCSQHDPVVTNADLYSIAAVCFSYLLSALEHGNWPWQQGIFIANLIIGQCIFVLPVIHEGVRHWRENNAAGFETLMYIFAAFEKTEFDSNQLFLPTLKCFFIVSPFWKSWWALFSRNDLQYFPPWNWTHMAMWNGLFNTCVEIHLSQSFLLYQSERC